MILPFPFSHSLFFSHLQTYTHTNTDRFHLDCIDASSNIATQGHSKMVSRFGNHVFSDRQLGLSAKQHAVQDLSLLAERLCATRQQHQHVEHTICCQCLLDRFFILAHYAEWRKLRWNWRNAQESSVARAHSQSYLCQTHCLFLLLLLFLFFLFEWARTKTRRSI